MSLAYIRDYYQVPAHTGRPVTVDGKAGVIVGARDQYLRVRLADETITAHPTWRVEYLTEEDTHDG